MITKIWVLSTGSPGESRPCLSEVFTTEEAAQAGYDKAMREEWASAGAEDQETCEPLPYPGDPDEAHEWLAAFLGPTWGQWELTCHSLSAGADPTAAGAT